MAVSKHLSFGKVDELYLDPRNPRLGRHHTSDKLKQPEILELMQDWKLDELAVSFIESGGFWSQEALLVVEEIIDGKKRLVVVEGNRRLAALMLLQSAVKKNPINRAWQDIAKSGPIPADLFEKVPYFLADSRKDVEAFLGFRHVTGIEEWRPAEKAEYIAKMIDEGMSYKQVMRKIGSKATTVRQNYIAYRLLHRMEALEEVPKENFQERFSVMYLSLRTEGVQKYLQIDIEADPEKVRNGIPKIHQKNLINFALWLFGNSEKSALFTDSRDVDKFGRALLSNKAVEYLERTENPNFQIAVRMAGGDEPEIVKLVDSAADNVEQALSRAHHYPSSKPLISATKRLAKDTAQLIDIFPAAKP